jgi:hypothetical protein
VFFNRDTEDRVVIPERGGSSEFSAEEDMWHDYLDSRDMDTGLGDRPRH